MRGCLPCVRIPKVKENLSKHLPAISTTRVVLAVTALIVVYFLITGVVSSVRSHQLHQQEGRLRAEIEQLQARHERLAALEEYLNSDEYIEAVAREQLGLVREGETGFVAISTAPLPTPPPNQAQPELWWDVLIR